METEQPARDRPVIESHDRFELIRTLVRKAHSRSLILRLGIPQLLEHPRRTGALDIGVDQIPDVRVVRGGFAVQRVLGALINRPGRVRRGHVIRTRCRGECRGAEDIEIHDCSVGGVVGAVEFGFGVRLGVYRGIAVPVGDGYGVEIRVGG